MEREGEGEGAAATQSLPGLPHEMELQILLKLPVKSLLRFGSVSKQWLSSISHPKFINSHLQLAKTRYDTILCEHSNGSFFSLGHDGCVEKFDRFVPNPKAPDDDPMLAEYRDIFGSYEYDDSFVPNPNPKASDDASMLEPYRNILGSCNGLLFGITGPFGEAYCWNPGTGKHVRVGCYEVLRNMDGSFSISGLGYNSSTGDYKAVVAITYVSPPSSPNPEGNKYGYVSQTAYVLSFKTRTWKQDYCPYFFLSSGVVGTVLDGNPHWVVKSEASWTDPKRLLIYFDFVDDHFKGLPPPPSTVTDSLILELGVLGGRELCVFITRSPDSSTSEVWAMKEYGVKESWVPLFDIPLSSAHLRLRPLCFTSSNKVLLTPRARALDDELDEDGDLFLYDPKADATTKIMVPTNSGSGLSPGSYTAFALEDSFEWIGDLTSAAWTPWYFKSSHSDEIRELDY